jgi:hypothetical protein
MKYENMAFLRGALRNVGEETQFAHRVGVPLHSPKSNRVAFLSPK